MSRDNSADDDRRTDVKTDWIAGEQAAQRSTDDDLRADGGSDELEEIELILDEIGIADLDRDRQSIDVDPVWSDDRHSSIHPTEDSQ